MRILILGAGKMGKFFCDLLSFNHDVGIYDYDPLRLRFTYNARRFGRLDEEVREFNPELIINAATVRYTVSAFQSVMPVISSGAMLSDVASVKTGLPEFYAASGHPYVSTHPMFGPTFASLSNLSNENAIIITESDEEGKRFFRDLYSSLHLHIEEYSFEQHDRTIAYSLSVPFASTLAFAGVMEPQDAPGTTFKRHMELARGLLGEDDYLLSEILFNPHTSAQLSRICRRMEELKQIVDARDPEAMVRYLNDVRDRIR